MESFIDSLAMDTPADLRHLREQAEKAGVPIVKAATESLLAFFMAEKKPKEILEIGTAVGYSGISMLRHAPGAHLTTLESYEPRIRAAKENFRSFRVKSRVTLVEGDATVFLEKNRKQFDFIFLDAAKAQYIHWLPDILRAMKEGTVLFSDNVFQEGDVLESRYLIRRRDRTIHERMREYLRALMREEHLETTILPIGDGVSISVWK